MNKYKTLRILHGFSLAALMIGMAVSCGNQMQSSEPVKTAVADHPAEPIASIAEIAPDAGVGRSIPEPEYEMIEVTATAYCPCVECCGKSDGITATGTVAKQGRTIAVDPDIIPYGTAVEINGNTYIAEDCGGAINGNRIDIFFNNHEDALVFGVQELTAIILG